MQQNDEKNTAFWKPKTVFVTSFCMKYVYFICKIYNKKTILTQLFHIVQFLGVLKLYIQNGTNKKKCLENCKESDKSKKKIFGWLEYWTIDLRPLILNLAPTKQISLLFTNSLYLWELLYHPWSLLTGKCNTVGVRKGLGW